MQISTRTEDFVVDTLKLRIHIGPYLREVFKDPTKRKVDLLLTNYCILFYFFGGGGVLDLPNYVILGNIYTQLGYAWSRSRYCVASAGLWHLHLQFV